MGNRLPLQIIDDKLILTAVIECASLRIQRQISKFVVDTGSSDSFLSTKEVVRLHVPTSQRPVKNEIDFGGSRYKQLELPKFTLHILSEENKPIDFGLSINALKTTKMSQKKIRVAETLPSILGMSFLKEGKLSLHVFMDESIAYLETS